jgi:hypothetical protein
MIQHAINVTSSQFLALLVMLAIALLNIHSLLATPLIKMIMN